MALDAIHGDSNAQTEQPHYLKACSKPNLDLGSTVYFLGYTEKKELTVGDGKVVIATDNLIKLTADDVNWSPGSAGFDAHGNLAFMICDPMKLATSPNAKSSTTSSSSSSSWKKDLSMHFGIPILTICDWLNQHWDGSLDDLNKPLIPLIRLMSTSQKSDRSSVSYTLRRVFKPTNAKSDNSPSSSNTHSIPRNQLGPSCLVAATFEEETTATDQNTNTHQQVQGILPPRIYESPDLSTGPSGKIESSQVQLVSINLPPRVAKAVAIPGPSKVVSRMEKICVRGPELSSTNPWREYNREPSSLGADVEIESTGSVNGAHIEEAHSSSSPFQGIVVEDGYSSEETVMYSAETAESRNYGSSKEAKFPPAGRNDTCVSYRRWGAQREFPEKHSFNQRRKMHSPGVTSQRSNEYFSPTVSSIMKKQNNSNEPRRPRQNAAYSSPRWMF